MQSLCKKKLLKVRTVRCLGCGEKLVAGTIAELGISMHATCEGMAYISLVQMPIRATTRKLTARWTCDLDQRMVFL